MSIATYRTSDSSHTLTAYAGLVAVAELIMRLGLSSMIDQRLPQRDSNQACPASVIFNTLMLLLHDGARCLADVRYLKQESAPMNLLGMSRATGARTLGNWLHALGCSAAVMSVLDDINRRRLKVGLHDCKRVPRDIDATEIEAHKKEAKWIYKKYPGFVPMAGQIAETEQVVATEFRADNVCRLPVYSAGISRNSP